MLLAHEGDIKSTDVVHSGKTVYPAIHFFTELGQHGPIPQSKILGLQ